MDSKHFITIYKPPNTATYTSAIDVSDEVSLLWSQAQENFIEIGRILNRAKSSLQHGEWGKLIRLHLPFEYSVANKLRKIASAVDNNDFSIDELPVDYTSAHLLVTAQPHIIEIARKTRYLHKNLTRNQIKDFIKRHKNNEIHEDIFINTKQVESKLAKLHKRLEQIAKMRAQLDKEEADILSEISQLERSNIKMLPAMIIDCDIVE